MVSGNLQNSALESLSEEEKKVVAQILSQISADGKSQLLDDIRYSDYKEIPVDIITFIKDNRYLGKAWHTSDGRCKLFPYWEKKLKEIFPDNLTTAVNNFIESGARGLGKAQPLDSLVFTEHGYRRMGDIHVGDRVYGNDGNLHNVIGVFPQGVKPVCRVTFSDKTSTLCSDEHLWTVYDNSHGGRQRTITCKEMYETGLKTTWGDTRYKIPITKPLQFSHKETFISPYMMGVFLGDGGFGFNAASFTSYDDEIVDAVKYEIAQNDYCLMPNDHSEGCRSWYIKNNNYVVGERTPNAYVEYAKKLNLAGKRAWEKHIPPEYLYNDVESRIALLQGLMDTDGEVDPLYQEAYTTTSKQLANDVVFLVQSLGGTAILKHYTNCTYKYKGESRPCRDSYTVNIKLPKSISAVRLNRKRIKLNPRRFEPFRMVKSIEYVEPQECQCILLDSEEHLYLTNDLIVTHNSEIAITIALYLMHRLMCLKDARTYYDIKPTEQIAFAFMNITETLSYDIGVTKFQNTVQLSPWFMERGEITGRQTKVWNPPEFIHIIVGSRPSHVIGQPVFFAFFDEISFIQNQDIEKQKEKAIDMIDTAIGGMKTRFIKRGQNPTLLCLASSKRSDKSFLEVHTRKKLESEKENVIIVDEPVWNVRPADEYCGVKFYVAQGNKYLASEIIPKGADLKPYKDRGFTIIEVPIEFYAEFYENIERALCDFAGVSSSDITKYIAGYRLQAVKKKELKNPFTKDIIEVGNGPEDKTQYYDFFDMNLVDEQMKSKPLYIHLDMSLSGDRTGIAGVWIKGKKPSADGETPSKDLYYQLAFSIAVKAPRGFQVSFEKNRQFIYWLKEKGFRIKGVSSDTYQSADLKQQLIAKGYKYDIISVDRVETLDDGKTKLCKPYHYFRNTLYEERIEMYDSELLTTELLGLERNSAGRIDHPDSGQSGSKDVSDAVCGALWNASQNAEEFAFDYGEDIQSMVEVSSSSDSNYQKQQVMLNFQEELQKVFGSGVSAITQRSQPSNDAQKEQYKNMSYIRDGIIPF